MYRLTVCVLLLIASAATASAHPASEAEILALESSGELIAPPELVAEIEADLQLIRAAVPVLQWVEVFPSWMPGELIIGLTPEASQRFLDGEHAELDALNGALGIVEVDQIGSMDYFLLVFWHHYHPELLVDDYEQIEGVRYASPNHLLGDGPDITREDVGLYLFRYGWGDCPAGCIENHYWRIQVTAQGVEVVEEWGQPLPAWVPNGSSSFGGLKAGFAP